MPLFKINGLKVQKITPKDLDLEKHLQALFEANLEELLNIIFLAHEYSTSSGGRIDTLGIDKNGTPCIIEYKRGQNGNVINQGLSYLLWLIDHKADFEKLVATSPSLETRNETVEDIRGHKIKLIARNEFEKINWDSPRVICIAESFNKFDLDTADILPIKIELMRYRIYDDNLLHLEPERQQKVNVPMSSLIRKGKGTTKKTEDIQLQKSYTVENHLRGASKEAIALFQTLRERIMSLDETIREEPMKNYIAYKLATNFVDIVLHNYGLKIFVNVKSGELNDPQGFARDLEKPKHIGHHGNGDYEIKLEKPEDLEAVFVLIKQSYDLNK